MLKQKSSEYRGYRTAGIRLARSMLPQLGNCTVRAREPMLPARPRVRQGAHGDARRGGPARTRGGRRDTARTATDGEPRAWSRPARASAAACTPASNT